MPSSPTPSPNSADPHAEGDRSVEVVTAFLTAMHEGDVDTVIGLADQDIVYTNVPFPTIHGEELFARGVRAFYRHHLGFEVAVHRISGRGSSVLTERTDALTLGPFRMQFWVCGVFEVENGQITLWRDYFDWLRCLGAILRGLAGIPIPGLRAKLPAKS